MVEVDFFPTKCFSLKIQNPKEVLEETIDNRESIKKVSDSKGLTWHKKHFTDFSEKVRCVSFERQIKETLSEMHKSTGLKISLIDYWTAIYGDGAVHEPHVHNLSVFDEANYSGILYLTQNGGTEFFSNNPSSFNRSVTVVGEVGDVFLFPSNLPHSSKKDEDGSERVIISFNLSVYGQTND